MNTETPDFSKRVAIKGFPGYYVIDESIWVLLEVAPNRPEAIQKKLVAGVNGNVMLKKADGTPCIYNYAKVVEKIRQYMADHPEIAKDHVVEKPSGIVQEEQKVDDSREYSEEEKEIIFKRMGITIRLNQLERDARRTKDMNKLFALREVYLKVESELREFDALHPEFIPKNTKKYTKERKEKTTESILTPEQLKRFNGFKAKIEEVDKKLQIARLNLTVLHNEIVLEFQKPIKEFYKECCIEHV
jgi:hypothetical protein